MTIACLIATFSDGGLLAEAVESAAPHVDRVIVLDGAYRGLDAWPCSPEEDLDAAQDAGVIVLRTGPLETFGAYWPGEIEKRNVLLELGRAFLPDDGDRWALVLDADELLVEGELLRSYLAEVEIFRSAPGLARREPNGDLYHAPSRLFRLTSSVRYEGRSYWLRAPDWIGPIDLSHSLIEAVPAGQPWIKHRWDRRSAERAALQRRWGDLLAAADGHGAHPAQ